MNSLGYDLKVFELNTLTQAGINITPQQVGLSSNPMTNIQLQGMTSTFGNVLSQVSGTGTTAQNLTAPVPPTPPAAGATAAQQTAYQQALVTYQSNFQVYNQRVLQLMLTQMQSMQQASVNANNSNTLNPANNTGGSSSSSSSTPPGIGGILD